MAHRQKQKPLASRPLIVGLFGLLVLLAWNAASAGLSSIFTVYASQTNQIASANTAVRLDQSNADAHYVRGILLQPTDMSAAATEFNRAVASRPRDFALWLSLAQALEQNGDAAGAIAAAKQAIPLAPAYAAPHYELGNILVRAGKNDEGFQELRIAGTSNPQLMRGAIDLAWHVSNGDAQYVRQVLAGDSEQANRELFIYFREHNQLDAATQMYTAAGSAVADDRYSFLTQLIEAGRIKEAAQLWGQVKGTNLQPGLVLDPGFEEETELGDVFGWFRPPQSKGFQLSLDTDKAAEGAHSLKIEFKGDSEPWVPVVSQLVLVEPSAHYQLQFASRSSNLVSGALPLVAVIDPVQKKAITQTEPFPTTVDTWKSYFVDFTAPQSSAVRIAVQRQPCDQAPCPAFGRLWLDNFNLKKL